MWEFADHNIIGCTVHGLACSTIQRHACPCSTTKLPTWCCMGHHARPRGSSCLCMRLHEKELMDFTSFMKCFTRMFIYRSGGIACTTVQLHGQDSNMNKAQTISCCCMVHYENTHGETHFIVLGFFWNTLLGIMHEHAPP